CQSLHGHRIATQAQHPGRKRTREPTQRIATPTSLHTASAETSHNFTSAVLDAAGGNLLIARDAGGWASAAMVDEVYGHVDIHDLAFDTALRTVWGGAQ
ncbi:hypothetical protein O3W51_48040, partial [Streptomyces sp. H39-C1]|nr:hypothetical protein [Streptomyces sp. H39-C1]